MVILLSTFLVVVSDEVPEARAEIFGANTRVDDTGANSSSQFVPSIAVSGDGRIFVAWSDTRYDAYGDIFAASSLDAGNSFLNNTKVNDDSGLAEQYPVDIALDSSGGVHAVWTDWRNDADGTAMSAGGVDGMDNATIYYSNSTDGGRTWSRNLMLSNDSAGFYDYGPRIAIDSKDTIHVIWESSQVSTGPHYILYSSSEDRGKTFSEPTRIDDSTGTSRYPSMAIDESDNIYVVWKDSRNGPPRWDIWFARSEDGGLTFEGYGRVNNDVASIQRSGPEISARNGLIGVIWYEEPFFTNISFAASFDMGESFSDLTAVNDDTSFTRRECPSLWIGESDYITVAWMTRRDGNEDIYFANSTDGGQSFSTNQKVNDDVGTDLQRLVDITMDSNGYVYLAWMDNRNGNWDIYFTRAPSEIADLEPIDLSCNPPGPVTEWTTVNLNATIRNKGDREAPNVLVRFFDGDPTLNVQIGPDQILTKIDANGGLAYADTQWIATLGGPHTIHVVVDPENNVTESNETNNVATVNISVISLRQPTITEAVLSGNDLENVTISWSLSPDDGMGSETVTGYNIYRNTAYNRDGMGYSFTVALPKGTSTFTDTGVGEGDSNCYFYRVCARDANNTTACSRTQAGKFTRPLIKGANLASLPLIQSDESLETVLQTVEFDKVWVYDSSSEKWKWFMTFKPYKGELKTINETQGFWVNATNDCNFTIAGIVPLETTQYLAVGWNLVSYSSFVEGYSVADLRREVGVAVGVEGFRSTSEPYRLVTMQETDVFEAGYGYWIEAAGSTRWTISN